MSNQTAQDLSAHAVLAGFVVVPLLQCMLFVQQTTRDVPLYTRPTREWLRDVKARSYRPSALVDSLGDMRAAGVGGVHRVCTVDHTQKLPTSCS